MDNFLKSFGGFAESVANAAGTFNIQSLGFIQGVALDDPAIRNALSGGYLDADETLPMWGGVGIYGNVPPVTSETLGTIVGRADNLTPYAAKQMVGFSVVNQATAWLTTPQSPAPTAAGGMTVPYFLFGSGARIAVDCDATLAAALSFTPVMAGAKGAVVSALTTWVCTGPALPAASTTLAV